MDELKQLLARTNLQTSFEDFLDEVAKTFGITIFSFEPILEGYENANLKITTDKGNFIIKIFAKDITESQAQDYIRVTEEGLKIGVPFPQLQKSQKGYLQKSEQGNFPVWYYLMNFFEGRNFEQQSLAIDDITTVTNFLATLNTLDFPIAEVYDSWGNKNIVTEYEKSKNHISPEISQAIKPVIEEFSNINFSGFAKGVIHGDLQRKHVLKNDKGEYCLLDLGCMRNDALVYDISILLAWFCLGSDTWNIRDEIVKKVLEIYTKIHPLTKNEVASLPILIKAAYAAYLLKTSILIQDGDTSKETRDWHEHAKEMLEKCLSWDWKYEV